MLSHRLAILVIIVVFMSTGCAKNYSPNACAALDPESFVETKDSFESYNRAMFNFNLKFDRAVTAPTAYWYRTKTPKSLQRSVTSFFNNLKEPRNILAAAMMGQFDGATQSTFRFIINSTIGLGGFIDIGQAAADLPYTDYDFGQALGYWGVGSGPYIVMPIVGPSTPRGIAGSMVHNRHTYLVSRIKKSEHQLFVQNAQWVNQRARLIPFTELLQEQPDPYIFARESYRQTRLNKVCSP